jgi:hypothetical protein
MNYAKADMDAKRQALAQVCLDVSALLARAALPWNASMS